MSIDNNLRLLRRIIRTEFILRDQGTFLGFLWTLLNPLFFFVTLYYVFSRNLGSQTPNFPGYLLIGILVWNFFSTAASTASSAIRRRANYFTNAPLSPSLFTIGSVISVFLTSCIEVVLATLFLHYWFNVDLLMLPYTIVSLMLTAPLVIGISAILAIVSMYFNDVLHLWSLTLRIGFFLTPVFYRVNILHKEYFSLIMLNPLTHFMNFARLPLGTESQVDLTSLFIIFIVTSVFAVYACWLLNRFRYRFTETI